MGPAKVGSSKFTTLEAGRAFAALMVVLYHFNVTAMQPKYFGYEPMPFLRGGNSGVEYFFVLSGFVMVVAHRKDLVARSGTVRFLWRRFQRLYPSLWVVVGVVITAMVAVPTMRWAGGLNGGDVVAALTAMPYPHERVLTVEWTLRYEVLFYLLFALTIRWRRVGAAGWLIWCASGVVSLWVAPHGMLGFFVAPFPLVFVAGMIVGLVFRRIPVRPAVLSVAVGGAVYLVWLTHLCIPMIFPDAAPIDAVTFGVGAALIVVGLASLEYLGKITAPRFLCFIGAASYSIYLVHYPAMSIFMKVAMKLRAKGVQDYAAVAFVLITVVGVGVLFHLLIEKRLLAITKRLGDKHFQGKSAAPTATSPTATPA